MNLLERASVYVDDLRNYACYSTIKWKNQVWFWPDGKDTLVTPFKYDSISLREEPPYFEAEYDGKKILLTTDGVEK